MMTFKNIRGLSGCLLVSLSFSFCSSSLNAQESSSSMKYQEFHKLEQTALEENNIKKLRRISHLHARKAQEEGNSVELARAFYFRVLTEDPKVALTYSDSMINATRGSDHANYPTLGYMLKGENLYNSGSFEEALENYSIAYELALEKGNEEHQLEISLAIAAIRNINGQHSAAIALYAEALRNLKRRKDFELTHHEDYSYLLYNLSLTHLRMGQLDSAKSYAKRGVEVSYLSEDSNLYRDFVLVDAQVNYFLKDLVPAQDSLSKYIDELEGTNKAIKLYYLGKIQQLQGNVDAAVGYYEKIDSIVTKTADPFTEIKDVYQQLILNASLKENKREQIFYIEKLIYYDSILSSQQKEISHQAVLAYDIPYLKHQKRKVEDELEIKNITLSTVGILAFMAMLSGLHFFIRAQKANRRLKLLLDKPVEKVSGGTVKDHTVSVPPEIREDILGKLKIFESSQQFLRKDLDMSVLAENLATNTTYLSTVVNHYKGMSFPNYLKDLKISYAINKLSEDPKLLKYSFQGLAEEFGFKTGESFSKAFYAKTGVHLSKFLGELKLRKNSRDL